MSSSILSPLLYPPPIERAIAQITAILDKEQYEQKEQHDKNEPKSTVSSRGLALLLLQQDRELESRLALTENQRQTIQTILSQTQDQLQRPLTLAIAQTRQQWTQKIEADVLSGVKTESLPFGEYLHQLTVNPVTGFPLLVLILYLGVYKFVGEFGAGTVVDWIEGFFEGYINPVVNQGVSTFIPWPVLQDLIANDYGIVTLGVRYAIAIVLPVVATYFLMFSLLEDSGYLPRLSLMLDQVFKTIGLSGRSVIPMVLGLGCDTMATVVTRTLETRRERIIATFLLSLAVPCAAQWGVILGLLAQDPQALMIWAGTILSIFLGVGYLTARLLPGQPADFYLEVPPLRWPKIQNILLKTYGRMRWYLWEILPLFIWASVFIWLGRLTGLFDAIVRFLEPITVALGLPTSAAPIFLYGFFRRDYGAAGLFDLQKDGTLDGSQLLIAAIVLTLFLPCIAQLQVMIKERGWQTTTVMVSFIVPFAFAVGYGVHTVLGGLEALSAGLPGFLL